MKGKLILFVCLLPILCFSQADSISNNYLNKSKTIQVNGFVDAYFTYDFAEPIFKERPSFFYNHTKHNEFSVNLALIQLNYKTENVRANLGLMAGTYAHYNLAHEQEAMRNIFEANAGIKLIDNFKHYYFLSI